METVAVVIFVILGLLSALCLFAMFFCIGVDE